MTASFLIVEPATVSPPAATLPVKQTYRSRMRLIFLQISHRLGAVSLLCTLASWAMMYQQKDFTSVLAVTAGTSEVGLVFGLLARLLTRRGSLDRSESNGVAVFNLVLFILAVYLMVFTRLDVIRLAAGQFFSPSTPPPAENHW